VLELNTEYTLQHSGSLTRERPSVEIDATDNTVGGLMSRGSSFLYMHDFNKLAKLTIFQSSDVQKICT